MKNGDGFGAASPFLLYLLIIHMAYPIIAAIAMITATPKYSAMITPPQGFRCAP